jgi:hypothetical protein
VSTDPAPIPTRDLADAQAYGRDAAGTVATMAMELRALADRLNLAATALERGDGKASGNAADIVNDYTQRTGSIGGRLWGVVYNASTADREYDKAQRKGDAVTTTPTGRAAIAETQETTDG